VISVPTKGEAAVSGDIVVIGADDAANTGRAYAFAPTG
jgi:hypothetical protein